MRHIVIALIVFIGFSNIPEVQSQARLVKQTKNSEIHFRPGSDVMNRRYVPPTKSWKSPIVKKLDYVVDYRGPISDDAKNAFENGVMKVINDNFETVVPIHIQLNWEQIDGNALAGARPAAYYSGFVNSANPEAVYAVALAEKISRLELNGEGNPDVVITINSLIDWYYNFNSPGGIGNQFDFVSVILHEVLHGLGFLSNTSPDLDNVNGIVRVFTDDQYNIFSAFLRNNQDVSILDIPDNTPQMLATLTSDNIFFQLTSKEDALKIYAPLEWEAGSSMSHLDEVFYSNSINSLMTPSASQGEIEHSLGVSEDLMKDMGWDFTYLLHTPEAGSENLNEDYIVEVEVISDSEVDRNSLKLVYSSDEFVTHQEEMELTLNASSGLYEGRLPATGATINYSYYLTAVNSRTIKFTNPGRAPMNYFNYFFSHDTIAPEIKHRSQRTVNDVDPNVTVVATVSDFYLGIDTIFIEWELNGLAQTPVAMQPVELFGGELSDDEFSGTLVYPSGPLQLTDKITYRITAIDKSINKNTTTLPRNNGDFKLSVTEAEKPIAIYVNNFDEVSDDFTGDFTVEAPTGFSSEAVHTDHPYAEAGNAGFINFIYELKFPILIQETDPIIEFDEIVLVEPGDLGALFGEDEFWDYVIVEGKKLGSPEWLPFLKGYDSSSFGPWLSAYNNGRAGSSSLFAKKTINMTANGNFEPGDQVFIRFRLFSDPAVNAWGWAFDNLKIQDVETAVEDFVFEENFSIYPNPVNNSLNIELDLISTSEQIKLSVVDLMGRTIFEKNLYPKGLRIREELDAIAWPDGLYFLNIHFNNRDVISKKFVKN